MAPLAVGAVPVIVDVDESLTMAPGALEAAITPRTRCIIPVHMHGLPCDMRAILAIAERHGIAVLEDACQACGGSYRGKPLGTLGRAGAFSFNQFKILTCGEGGALVTADTELYERALIMHDGGCAFFRQEPMTSGLEMFAGLNFRTNEILSAILRVQLTRLDSILAALRREKQIIRETLAAARNLQFAPVRDEAGDCATVVPVLLESQSAAEGAHECLLAAGLRGSCPKNNHRHVYSHWAAVLDRRGAHHPKRDPLQTSPHVPNYNEGMCPQTLDVLNRTLLIETSVTREENELRGQLAAFAESLEKLQITT
jgi:dTDP-4-amino-4,6-dideoxygalactose transaminase